MGLASNGAHSDLQSSWRERRMPDNFPKLVLANIPQIPKELVAASQQGIDSGTTGWLDVYRCDKDRMAHAAIEEPGQGIFHLEGPATDAFSDFDALARVVSYDLYKLKSLKRTTETDGRSLLRRGSAFSLVENQQCIPVTLLPDFAQPAQITEGFVLPGIDLNDRQPRALVVIAFSTRQSQ
jgi:hypothetical protein